MLRLMKGRSERGGSRISETNDVTRVVNAAANLSGRFQLWGGEMKACKTSGMGNWGLERVLRSLHQTYSYLQDVILHGEVGEAAPELLGASLYSFPGAHQALSAFMKVELRHVGGGFVRLLVYACGCCCNGLMRRCIWRGLVLAGSEPG